MKDRKPVSLGERWRRIVIGGIDDKRLEMALATLPSVRSPRVRILAGAITAEMEGVMGSIHEVDISVPTLPVKIWPQVARVMRRSTAMIDALGGGRVPRSFDRLVARMAGEALMPDARRVSASCTCNDEEVPCKHVLALHELFARRLEEKPWELLILRGVDLHDLLQRAKAGTHEELPDLPYGAAEEPILFPEGEERDLDFSIDAGQAAALLGVLTAHVVDTTFRAIDEAPGEVPEAPPPPPVHHGRA